MTIISLGLVPSDGFLRLPATGTVLDSPFMKGIVAFIFIGASLAGIAYGLGAGTLRSDTDVMKGMGKAMETLGLYLVLVFFASQFVAYFKWSNLGLIFAIKGAEVLKASGLGPIPLDDDFHPAVGGHQFGHRKRFRQMGHHGSGFCTDVYAIGLLS